MELAETYNESVCNTVTEPVVSVLSTFSDDKFVPCVNNRILVNEEALPGNVSAVARSTDSTVAWFTGTGPVLLSVCVDRTKYTKVQPLSTRIIAEKLAQVDGVVAVYASSSSGTTRIWTVLSEDDDATLDAVFEQELVLYDDYGDGLASIEFHVLSQDVAGTLALGEKVYPCKG